MGLSFRIAIFRSLLKAAVLYGALFFAVVALLWGLFALIALSRRKGRGR
jgi:hypothetical protein